MFWKNQLVRYLVMNIRHIGLVVSNLNDSLKFWRDIIGFKIKKKKHERGKTIDNVLKIKNCKVLTIKMVDKKNNMLELIKFNSSIKKKDRKIFTNSNGFTHIALTVDNLDLLYKKLRKNNVFNCPPQLSEDRKVKLTYLRTPEGAFLELVEELN